MQESKQKRRAQASRCCQPRSCVAVLRAGQVHSPRRRPLPHRTGHAGKDREEPGKKAGRSPTSPGRAGAAEPHFPSTFGRGVPRPPGREATLPRLSSAPPAPPRRSAVPAWRRRGPRSLDRRSASAASGEVRAGRGGGKGDAGGESRARGRGRSPSCCRRARPEAPEPRQRCFPLGPRAGEGGRSLAPGRGGRTGRRGQPRAPLAEPRPGRPPGASR